jgi:hypothetical protein
MESILLIFGGCMAVLYWRSSQQCKVYAIAHAKRECDKHGVQLLDQTVQQVRVSLSRDELGKWRFWRHYRFEYSGDGVDRQEGRLIMLGYRLVRSVLDSFDPVIH